MVIFALWAGACSVLALVKLIGFVRSTGLRFNIAQICLLIELIANMFRLIYLSLDPIYAGRIFLAHQAHMMITISWPLTIITTLLITLYWLELLTQNRVRVPGFLSSLRWPFVGVSLLMVALELATSISRALSLGQLSTLTLVSGILYAIILAATTLLFFIVGTRTLKQLRDGGKIASQNATAKRILSKTTKLVMASGGFSVLWIVGTLLSTIRQIFWDYRGYYVSWSIVFTGLLGISITQILSFTPPPLASTSTRGSGANTTATVAAKTTIASRSVGSRSTGSAPSSPRSYELSNTNENTDENTDEVSSSSPDSV
jgi:hypothetical protein